MNDLSRALLGAVLATTLVGCDQNSADLVAATPDDSLVATDPINDTGIDWCYSRFINDLSCPVEGYPGQDGEFGRDMQAREGWLAKVGAGAAGFDFTKLDASGDELPGNANEWYCVRDNHTGLIWEVKTADGQLRDSNNTYTWYNPDVNTNGGSPGTPVGGNCTTGDCNTYDFVSEVNSDSLCGASDWRLPTRKELMGIVHNGERNPAIDLAYFPNTPTGMLGWYWTSSPNAANSTLASRVNFFDGNVYFDFKSYDLRVRLVRTDE